MPRTIDAEAEPGLDALPASELEVMRLLVRRPALTVGEVARELGLQPTNASTAIRTLVGRGLLERQGDAADGRVTRLVPTPRAIENREHREQVWAAALAGRLGVLSPAQAVKVLRCAGPLRALADALAAG
jgi:DNA-binding MarR family transcriptional regulator